MTLSNIVGNFSVTHLTDLKSSNYTILTMQWLAQFFEVNDNKINFEHEITSRGCCWNSLNAKRAIKFIQENKKASDNDWAIFSEIWKKNTKTKNS